MKSKEIGCYACDRLREPSTWRGIVMILIAAGVSLSPDRQDAIISAGLFLVGLIGALTRDDPTKCKKEDDSKPQQEKR